jgi:hypothetical protein
MKDELSQPNGLIGAGFTIMSLGVTTVTAPEDLRSMAVTRPMRAAVHERIIPLIAHDQAGFGGAAGFVNRLACQVAMIGQRIA